MKYHIFAFIMGFVLDMILGDPYCLPHPVRLIGKMISVLENRLIIKQDNIQNNNQRNLHKGALLVFIVCAVTLIITSGILVLAYYIDSGVGVVIESVMTYQILATKCLKVESMKVYSSLKNEGLVAARKSVSMIVGRDTQVLDEKGVIKAAVETVAENTSDGSIAPMLYTAIGGPILGFLYKAVNTMDSMIGYKNDKYMYFGRVAAKLDDIFNYIPSRISAYLMIFAAFAGGKDFDGKMAYKIYKRDNRKHASPNSAQTESVCAGALGIQLAGDASYFGKIVKKYYIGDATRDIECEDIKRVNHLMYLTVLICAICCVSMMVLVKML